jgi:hypothetical protein
MMISCWRFTQPAKIVSRNVSTGGPEPMPAVYREASSQLLDITGSIVHKLSVASDYSIGTLFGTSNCSGFK